MTVPNIDLSFHGSLRAEAKRCFLAMQQTICDGLSAVDGASFGCDSWERTEDDGDSGGGGVTRVLREGSVFEKAGVNFSEVYGMLGPDMAKVLIGADRPVPFYAVGTSLVIHPHSPLVPTIHANCRFLEVAEKRWFGGGIDLTPFVLFEEDALHFHRGLKAVCERYDASYYPRFKKWCDEYFYIPHRKETRGIGGIFFDYLGRDDPDQLPHYFAFTEGVSASFNDLYLPIVKRRRTAPWSDAQKRFQLLRRGRYVEFNLVYDRGTLFGLKTGGRIESILMSLPQYASWEYNVELPPGSPEAALTQIFQHPREWV